MSFQGVCPHRSRGHRLLQAAHSIHAGQTMQDDPREKTSWELFQEGISFLTSPIKQKEALPSTPLTGRKCLPASIDNLYQSRQKFELARRVWGRTQAEQRPSCREDLSLGLRFNQNTASARSRQSKYLWGKGG